MLNVHIIIEGPADRQTSQAGVDAIATMLPPWLHNITAPRNRNAAKVRLHIVGQCATEEEADAAWALVEPVIPEGWTGNYDWTEDMAADRRREWEADQAAVIAAKVAADVTAVEKVYEVLDKTVMDEKLKGDLRTAIAASTGIAAEVK